MNSLHALSSRVPDEVWVPRMLASPIPCFNDWLPLGSSGDQYTVIFHGNGAYHHKVGLFGSVDSRAIIRSVGLEDVYVLGDHNAGSLVGRNEWVISFMYYPRSVVVTSGWMPVPFDATAKTTIALASSTLSVFVLTIASSDMPPAMSVLYSRDPVRVWPNPVREMSYMSVPSPVACEATLYTPAGVPILPAACARFVGGGCTSAGCAFPVDVF